MIKNSKRSKQIKKIYQKMSFEYYVAGANGGLKDPN